MEKFYIGLANGIHDPAMAVVEEFRPFAPSILDEFGDE